MTFSSSPTILPPGIYCPSVTFFLPQSQELDLDTFSQHVEHLARAGLHGIVIGGSNGEAVALTREEIQRLVQVARRIFKGINPSGVVIAGTAAAQSTREAIDRAHEAAEAGAEFALVLPPSYYPAAMTPTAIAEFYEDVADASPIPLIIYSYPAVSSGIVMDTDLILRLAQHPRIAGVKHTDHEVGRIAREVATLRRDNSAGQFTVLAGGSDYLLGTFAVGGQGAITGMANIVPRVLARLFDLDQKGNHAEAAEVAEVVSRSEWTVSKTGLLGTKYAVQRAYSYPEYAAAARKPLPPVSDTVKQDVQRGLAEAIALERRLEGEDQTFTRGEKGHAIVVDATSETCKSRGDIAEG